MAALETYLYNMTHALAPQPSPHSVPLNKVNRHGQPQLFFFSFFQFSLEAQSPQLLSKEDTSCVGKEGGQQR